MKKLFHKASQAKKLLLSPFKQTPLITGLSDILVIKRKTNQYFSTPFHVCFGDASTTIETNIIKLYINNQQLTQNYFTVDKTGYLTPRQPSNQILQHFKLQYGKNAVKFQLDTKFSLCSQIFLYHQSDKILISDMDGTMTKSDLTGLYNNYKSKDYAHDGYYDLLRSATQKGYKIVWLTMRSLSLYTFSKNYINSHFQISGVLLTQPQQFLTAVKKQLLKKTKDVKTNMLLSVKKLFPNDINPFIAGLGNRQNDAIAYLNVGIPQQNVFLINKQSSVYNYKHLHGFTNYKEMSQNIDKYFSPSAISLKKTWSQFNHQQQFFDAQTIKKSNSQNQNIHDLPQHNHEQNYNYYDDPNNQFNNYNNQYQQNQNNQPIKNNKQHLPNEHDNHNFY